VLFAPSESGAPLWVALSRPAYNASARMAQPARLSLNVAVASAPARLSADASDTTKNYASAISHALMLVAGEEAGRTTPTPLPPGFSDTSAGDGSRYAPREGP